MAMATVLDIQIPLQQEVAIPHWCDLLHHYVENNPEDHHPVVTQVSLYKQRSLWPNFQHEFIVLEIRPHPRAPRPHVAPVTLRVSRNVHANNNWLTRALARWGLCGAVHDTVLNHGYNFPILDGIRLYHIDWQLEDAPRLQYVSAVIYDIHTEMPKYCLLTTSCYTFARAVLETLNGAFNGPMQDQEAGFLTQQGHFLGVIPVRMTGAQRLAQGLIRIYRHHDWNLRISVSY